MKWVINFCSLLLVILGIAVGCQSPPDNDVVKQKTIGISIIGATHGWPVGVRHYAEEAVQSVAEANGWAYITLVGDTANEQSIQVIELVEAQVDCIIMLPMDGAALKTAAKAVQSAGIPLIIFDREIPDFAPAATVKGDNPGIGILTAAIFNETFSQGTTVLEIMGDASTIPFQRTAGFDDTIRDDFIKIQLGYTDWQRDQSEMLFKKWVQDNDQSHIDQVGAIFTHDDEIALGVLDALQDYKDHPELSKRFSGIKVVASSSGSQELYQAILEHSQLELFSLTYAPSMIIEAVFVAERILKGEPYEEMTIIETICVNRSNVSDYLDPNAPF